MNKKYFEDLYNIQFEFTDKLIKSKIILEENSNIHDEENEKHLNRISESLSKEYILSLYKQVGDLLDPFDWDMIVEGKKDEIKDNFLENIVDVIKLSMGLAIVSGFTSDQIEKKFLDKSKVVQNKFDQEFLISKAKNKAYQTYTQYALVDIDGVISDYPRCLMDFANKGGDYESFSDLKDDLENYDRIKELYRTSGYKANLPVIPESLEMLKWLNDINLEVIFMTSRPYEKYSRIYHDTIEWLDKNEIKYSAIIWSKNKGKEAIKRFSHLKSNVVFAIDDQLEYAKQFSDFGFNTFLKKNLGLYSEDEYYKFIDENPEIKSVDEFSYNALSKDILSMRE